MMPIHPSTWISYTFAVFAGFAFGFVLERVGFGSSRKLAAQFYLRDMTVLKVMFTAIVTAMLGLVTLRTVGLLDFDALYVNPTYLWPQIVGGLVFGAGFVLGGYCPGTSVVAAMSGKLDALMFIVGVGGGALVFAGVSPRFAGFMAKGGERTLLVDWLHLSYGTVAILVTLLALAMFAGAEWIERKLQSRAPGAAGSPKDEADEDDVDVDAASTPAE